MQDVIFLAQASKNQHTCQSCDCLFGGVKRARSSKAADFSPLPPSRFDEEGFNGIYANLGIKSVFAKPYNARAKVIERFFLEFQEKSVIEKVLRLLYFHKLYLNLAKGTLKYEKFFKEKHFNLFELVLN